jgi:hypothetical protein
LGIRVKLGAAPGRIVAGVLNDGLTLAIAAGSCVGPRLRASRTEPMTPLRAE